MSKSRMPLAFIRTALLFVSLAVLPRIEAQEAGNKPEKSWSQPAIVKAFEMVRIFARVSGRVEKWNVDIGDKVKKDQILATLDAPELRAAWETKKAQAELDREGIDLALKTVRIAEANVKAADAKTAEAKAIVKRTEAEVERWEMEVKRVAALVERGVVDRQVLTEAENKLKSFRFSLEAARAALLQADVGLLATQAALAKDAQAVNVARAKVKLSDSEMRRVQALVRELTIVAPFDGVITQRGCNVGDVVGAAGQSNEAPLFTVQRTDILRVIGLFPELDAPFIHAGDKAEVEIHAFPGKKITSRVARIAGALAPKTRVMAVEIDVANPTGQIYPGMSANATIFAERRKE